MFIYCLVNGEIGDIYFWKLTNGYEIKRQGHCR